MDWPITPTFFRKVGVYQRLDDAEKGFKQKHIWDAEKLVLKWANSADHQLVGSPIDSSHVKDILKKEIYQIFKHNPRKALELADFYVSFSNNLLEAMVLHGFAEVPLDASPGAYAVRITPDGFMAGRILEETRDLTKKWPFNIAVNAWWIGLFLAGMILVRQAFSGFPQVLWDCLRGVFTP